MRFLLTSHGSTGDIYPVIRLGRALLDAGHKVRFATVPLFREEIETAGIEFVYLPPDWERREFAGAMRELTKARNSLDLLRVIYSQSLPFLDDILDTLEVELGRADVFVTSYLFANLCGLARKVGVPCAVLTFAHNVVPSQAYPPENLPKLSWASASIQRRWNQMLWWMADRAVCWQINRVVGAAMRRHGMGEAESFAITPSDLILVAVSPSLFQPKCLWDSRFHYTGYLRWQSAEDPDLSSELDRFCEGERVPILTFGSVSFDGAREMMARFVKEWPLEKKIIIQSGWADLGLERQCGYVKTVGRISHDQLFHRASMVIHHGGAGTTASVLYAGVPSIIIPHISDQWFFASEVKRLGVGLELERHCWPVVLPEAVQVIEHSGEMQARARVIASQLAAENGPEQSVQALEDLVLSGN